MRVPRGKLMPLACGVFGGILLAMVPRATASPAGDGTGAVDPAQAIAIMANADCPIDDVSIRDLKKLYQGRTTMFPGGDRVLLVEHEELRDAFYRLVARRSGDEMAKFWIRLVFSGDSATPPIAHGRVADIYDALQSTRGGIAFVPAGEVPDGIKILRVDGKLPGDAGYPLVVEP